MSSKDPYQDQPFRQKDPYQERCKCKQATEWPFDPQHPGKPMSTYRHVIWAATPPQTWITEGQHEITKMKVDDIKKTTASLPRISAADIAGWDDEHIKTVLNKLKRLPAPRVHPRPPCGHALGTGIRLEDHGMARPTPLRQRRTGTRRPIVAGVQFRKPRWPLGIHNTRWRSQRPKKYWQSPQDPRCARGDKGNCAQSGAGIYIKEITMAAVPLE